jgi:hypothetical protein
VNAAIAGKFDHRRPEEGQLKFLCH